MSTLGAACLLVWAGCGAAPGANETPVGSEADAVVEEQGLFETPAIDFPAPEPVLGFLDARHKQSLNGDWHAIVDPMCVGCPGAPFGSFAENHKRGALRLVEYDFEASDTLRVPGDWNTQRERLFFYRGPVWYYRTFVYQAPPSAGSDQQNRVFLHFGGANFSADVFLNGVVVGRQTGGYVPFSFDITDLLKEGAHRESHQLVVRVDNALSDTTVPTGRTDWWPYGGLTRDVDLVTVPNGHIRNGKVSTVALGDGGRGAEVAVSVTTSGTPSGTNVSLQLDELNVSQTSTVDAQGVAEFRFTTDLELWSPSTPKLYHLTTSTDTDQVHDRVGFRQVATQGHAILLNGEPLKLRGISTHEEPIQETSRDHGVMFEQRQAQRVLTEAKALGANFVRLAHYPHSRHMAQVADELGLMLWAEIPVYWNIAWDNQATLEIARDQMQRLIHRDWNRASVIIWSIANETPLSTARMSFLERLATDVREHDPTRLVSAALLGNIRKDMEVLVPELARRALGRTDLSDADRERFTQASQAAADPVAHVTLEVSDPLEDFVDVLATNEYYGWYYSVLIARTLGVSEAAVRRTMLDMMPDLRITARVDKPLFVSEFGAGAKAGTRSPTLDIWSEDYQAAVYRAQIAMLRQSPQVAGMSPWILKDFRAMLRTLPGVQDYYNRKGLIAPDGTRKQAFEVLRSFYAEDW